MPLSRRVRDLASFDLLLSVAELGSMAQAANQHGVSQPAVSARLRTLEATLDLTLLDRSPQGTRLTPAGALVADWARTAVSAAASLDEGVAALRAETRSRLRVAASLTVAEYLLPGWLVALRSALPATTVALTSHNSVDTAHDVRNGAAEIGFVEGPQRPEGLEARAVAHDRLTLVVGADHPWSRRRGVRPHHLTETPLVAREQGSGTRTFLEQALADSGHGRCVAPALELSSTTSIKNAVIAGVAPAVLSSLAVTAELAAGSLVAVPVREIELGRTLRAVWPSRRPLATPARELLAIAQRGRTDPREHPPQSDR